MEIGRSFGPMVEIVEGDELLRHQEKQKWLKEMHRWAQFLHDLLRTPYLGEAYRTSYTILLVSAEANYNVREVGNEVVVEVSLNGHWTLLRRCRIMNHFQKVQKQYDIGDAQYEIVKPLNGMLWPTILRMKVPVADKRALPFIPISLAKYEEVIEQHHVRVYRDYGVLLPELGATVPNNYIV